ncbi:hypothetical protein HMPREF0880_00401 [Yokenella regensburgei ATCC 43003]|nr:hypothetical protein HMPREF0880_00401 [Yokenella regensburgei ATCC 43003]
MIVAAFQILSSFRTKNWHSISMYSAVLLFIILYSPTAGPGAPERRVNKEKKL